VRAGGKNFGKNRGIHGTAGFQGGVEASDPSANDDNIMFMNHHNPPLSNETVYRRER
jgi:hypothetical protein